MSLRTLKLSPEDGGIEEIGLYVPSAYARVSRTAPILDAEGTDLVIPAPNAIEWVTGAQWCNAPSLYEITRQYQVIRDFFELRCPVCNEGGVEDGEPGDTWGKGREALEAEALLVWNDEYQEDVCPKCRSTRSELLEDGLFTGYNQLHLVVGQRAGKSICAAFIGTYIEHRLITLGLSTPGGLFGYFDIVHGDVLEVTFLAATDVQSQDTIWAKYTGIRGESPWFRRFVPWVKTQEQRQARTSGMKPWFYKETEKKVTNLHPSIRLICNSANSNSPGLRGRTRPAAFADEISHMDQTESKRSAKEVYSALERSLRTVRSCVKASGGLPWLGSIISVTSPVSRSDKGWQLLQVADRVPSMYAKHYPTWKFNPREPRENFDSEFASDPIGAMRDYGASPPGSEYPYIHDESKFRALTIGTVEPKIQFEQIAHVDKLGNRYKAARVRGAYHVRDNVPRYIAVDAGATFDAFSVAIGHPVIIETGDGPKKGVAVDGVCRIVPALDASVWFPSIVSIVESLMPYFLIARVEFDRWQSIHAIQEIRDLGVYAEQKSLTTSDFVRFRLDAFAGLVQLLAPEDDAWDPSKPLFHWTKPPIEMEGRAATIYEICGLQQDPDTQKVSNPAKGKVRGENSDDTAQAVIHMAAMVQRQGFTDKHDDRSRRAARDRAEAGGRDWGTRGGIARPDGSGARGPGRGW